MFPRVVGIAGAIILFVLAKFSGGVATTSQGSSFTKPGAESGAPRVMVEAADERVLIRLSGRVDDTMASSLGAALAGFRYERRPLVISSRCKQQN